MTWPSKSAFNFRISARFDFPIDFHSSPPFPPTFSNANFARNLLPLTAVRKGERENLFLFLDSQFSHFYLCPLLSTAKKMKYNLNQLANPIKVFISFQLFMIFGCILCVFLAQIKYRSILLHIFAELKFFFPYEFSIFFLPLG